MLIGKDNFTKKSAFYLEKQLRNWIIPPYLLVQTDGLTNYLNYRMVSLLKSPGFDMRNTASIFHLTVKLSIQHLCFTHPSIYLSIWLTTTYTCAVNFEMLVCVLYSLAYKSLHVVCWESDKHSINRGDNYLKNVAHQV